MIFKQYQQVLDGTKTQTRRPVKDGDSVIPAIWGSRPHPDTICRIETKSGRMKWQRGCEYAVQPGRGKPAIWLPPEGAPIDDPLAEYIRKTESVRATWGPKVKAWLRAKGYQEARIRITKIRRERLQEISGYDVMAEGTEWWAKAGYEEGVGEYVARKAYASMQAGNYITAFYFMWNSLYPQLYNWASNPEVWVLEFELKEKNDEDEG